MAPGVVATIFIHVRGDTSGVQGETGELVGDCECVESVTSTDSSLAAVAEEDSTSPIALAPELAAGALAALVGTVAGPVEGGRREADEEDVDGDRERDLDLDRRPPARTASGEGASANHSSTVTPSPE